MATIRKRGTKWQVQIRRVGVRPISRSFNVRKDAEAWARQMEVQADRRDLPSDPKSLQRVTLGQLVERYRDTVSVRKRGYDVERIAPPGTRRDNQKAACKNFENLLELPSE
jgi:hypothetical protein